MVWPSRPHRAASARSNRTPLSVTIGRFMRRLFVFIVVIGFGAGCYFTTRYVHHFVYETDYFKLGDIEIRGASPELEKQARASLPQILDVYGDNLVRQKSFFIQTELGKLPRAKSVSVHKVYPRSLQIEFVERQPVMVASLDETFLVDREGVLISRIHALEATRKGLPFMTGIQSASANEGDKLDIAQIGLVLAAVEFIQANDKELASEIIEWNIDKSDVTAIMRGGAEVRFGSKPPLELMDKLSGAYRTPKIRAEFEQATYIDLRMDSQLVIMPKQI